MANVRRLKRLIAALRTRAGGEMFNIDTWVELGEGGRAPRDAFKNGGACGTTACIAGMAAVIDKKWKIIERVADWADSYKYLEIRYGNRHSPVTSFAEWAGVSVKDAYLICVPDSYEIWPNGSCTTAAEAADLLERFIANGCTFRGMLSNG